jgi:hypothetical protein
MGTLQCVPSRGRWRRPRLWGPYGVTAIATGPFPTWIGLSAVLVAVRTGVTVPENWLAT